MVFASVSQVRPSRETFCFANLSYLIHLISTHTIFYGVFIDEFHRISHVKTAKEAWTILETTFEGTKKVKDTKLEILTTRFEELRMSDDESFDSFYGKLNEIVIAKLNLEEKIEDAKVVRKILRSLPESFRAKVTAIEESKDLDEIKIQELIVSLQTYELGLPSHKSSKSLAFKTINERMDDSFEEDDVEKEIFHPPKVIGRSSRRKMGRILNSLKESCTTNATVMDISRRSVPTI